VTQTLIFCTGGEDGVTEAAVSTAVSPRGDEGFVTGVVRGTTEPQAVQAGNGAWL
jgi:hypothetical protein